MHASLPALDLRPVHRLSNHFISLGLGLMLSATCPTAAASESRIADAAEKLDHANIRALLQQHSDVNAPQADGMTALHWATHLDDLETALLVKAGAHVVENRYGVTPLSGVSEGMGIWSNCCSLPAAIQTPPGEAMRPLS